MSASPDRPITQGDLIAALMEIEMITASGRGLGPETTIHVHLLAGIGRAMNDDAAWPLWPHRTAASEDTHGNV